MKQNRTTYGPKYAKMQPRFPNTAARNYKLNKFIDYLLTAATTVGVVVAILFLVTL
ncbi:MAG: hypothetical protein J6Q30_03405 [Oscillospiraceae bacterium]|nr:hypothetical protein [Oscillospiraceae bacterium]